MKTFLATAGLIVAFAIPASATQPLAGAVIVDNTVIKKKCKKGFVKTSSGKCVRKTRGSSGGQPRGSY